MVNKNPQINPEVFTIFEVDQNFKDMSKLINLGEIWRTIKDYPDHQVSNLGRVRNSYGRIRPPQLGLHNGKPHYYQVALRKNNIGKSIRIHRLVAEAFIPNPENKRTVNHKDGNKLNNQVNNLEWQSYSENHKHAFTNNLRQPVTGELHGQSKLTKSKVLKIRELYCEGVSQATLSKIYNISQPTLSAVVNRKTWAHL